MRMPGLAEYGLIGPHNCSGNPPRGHGDHRLVAVSHDQGTAIGLPCPLLLDNFIILGTKETYSIYRTGHEEISKEGRKGGKKLENRNSEKAME
jgi:hypothetical protein